MIRHATLLWLTFIVVLLAGGCSAANEPVRLTVLTYNIHHAEGTDKKLDLPRIAGVIRSCNADLVALQEVDRGTARTNRSNQPAALARLLDMHVAYGPAMEFQGGKYGNAILSRRPIVWSRTLPLPHRPGGRREPRVAVTARCKVRGGGEVLFASTHLDHTREPSDRLSQAQALGIMQVTHFTKEALPTILAGDFNCEPGSPPMEQLKEHGWSLVSGANASFVGANESKSIDHVLVSDPAGWRVVEARVIDEPVASDHRPVLVILERRR